MGFWHTSYQSVINGKKHYSLRSFSLNFVFYTTKIGGVPWKIYFLNT